MIDTHVCDHTFSENGTLLNVLYTLRYEYIIFGKYGVIMNTEILIQIYGKKDRTYFDNYIRGRYARATYFVIKGT